MPTPFNPYALKRPEVKTETREFTDPTQPDVVFVLTLKTCPGFNDSLAVHEQAQKWVVDFVTGRNNGPPAALNVPGFGLLQKPTEAICVHIARLSRMQVASEESPALDFAGWCAVAEAMPTAFGQILLWSQELQEQGRGELKNAPEGDSVLPSEAPSTIEAGTIPNSSPEPMGSSGVSTNG